MPLSFLNSFANLQEIIFSFEYPDTFEGFNKLQHVTFPQLHILKFQYACPDVDMLIKFLEINGKNLTVFYVGKFLKEKELLKVVSKYSPKNFYELKIDSYTLELLPEDLESFFTSWKDRIPRKSFSLIIVSDNFCIKDESMRIIEKYKTLGIIKKFGTERYD